RKRRFRGSHPMQTRNRVPTIFSIYMLDVICCALGCIILLWQLKHGEAEEQTAAARKAETEARLAEEKWKQASTEVHSVTAEIDALKRALADSEKKHALVSAQLDEARKERDEANRLVALSQKEYDTLRQAWLLSEALLKNVRGDLDKLKQQQKMAAMELADKV